MASSHLWPSSIPNCIAKINMEINKDLLTHGIELLLSHINSLSWGSVCFSWRQEEKVFIICCQVWYWTVLAKSYTTATLFSSQLWNQKSTQAASEKNPFKILSWVLHWQTKMSCWLSNLALPNKDVFQIQMQT